MCVGRRWAAHEEVKRSKGATYAQTIWLDLMVKPVYAGRALPLPGDIGNRARRYFATVPPHLPIEIWSIDSAKTHPHFVDQAAAVWPRLRVGSIIHLMDFIKAQLVFWWESFVL